MPTVPTKHERKYELAPEGTHLARIVQFFHIGTIQETIKGETKDRNKVRLVFELPLETYEYEGVQKPHLLAQEYTLSLNQKAALRKIVDGLEGRSLTEEEEYSYDVEALVGKECMVQVVHNESKGSTYANVANVMPTLKGAVCPAQITPRIVFSYAPFDPSLFASLPEFLRTKIEASKEFKVATGTEPSPTEESPW